jgi:glycoside/pentoside/hexuronide:cation symporter, GPH family
LSLALAVRPCSGAGVNSSPATLAASAASADPPRSTMSWPLYVGWGFGTLGLTSFMVGSYLLLRFMTDYMGVAPALAGTIFALAKIYDGIADPILGSISDRAQTRWGRRRPFLLAGAFACGLTFMLAFNAPIMESPRAAVAMLAGLLILHATSYAIFAVPYMAMPAEMTDDPHERSKLMSARVINGSLGNLVGGWATASLIAWFGGGLAGHRAMGVVVGLIIFFVLLACFGMTKHARRRDVAVGHKHVPYRKQMRSAMKNRPFAILQAAKLMLLTAAALHTGSAAFFVQRRLESSDAWLGAIFATLTVGTVISQPFWLWLTRRLGKRDAFTVAGIFTAGGWIISVGVLAGVGNGGIVMISQSMLPDTIEYQRRQTGMHVEGSFAGVYIMVEKLGQAIGTSLTGLILGLFGYIHATGGKAVAQPPSAVLGITLIYCVISTAFLLASVAAMRFYPLDERSMTLIGEPRS